MTLKYGFKDLLAQANAVIETIAVQDLPYVEDDPDTVILDVRNESERKQHGEIPGSVHASRGFLEFHADPDSPMHVPQLTPSKRVIVYCATGGRSALAAKTLQEMGYKDVASLAGGFAAWEKANRQAS